MSVPRRLEAKFASMKVLVIDDQHHMRKVVRTILAALGIKNVSEANDGAAGLEATLKLAPDLIIVDWDMPVLDGLQFIQMVRSPGEFRPRTCPSSC